MGERENERERNERKKREEEEEDFRSKQIGAYYHKYEQHTSIYFVQFSHPRNESNIKLASRYLDKM